MAPTEGGVARPERRWGCRRGTPVWKWRLIQLNKLHVTVFTVFFTHLSRMGLQLLCDNCIQLKKHLTWFDFDCEEDRLTGWTNPTNGVKMSKNTHKETKSTKHHWHSTSRSCIFNSRFTGKYYQGGGHSKFPM